MRKIAFIGTGGTISSIGTGPLDIVHYGAHKMMLPAGDIIAAVPEVQDVAQVIAVPFANIPSPNIGFAQWKEISALCSKLMAETKDLAGIVIGHGTATLEETAYALGLTLKVSIPVVIVGSQRPLSGLGSDASMNLVNAVRVAADPESLGRGVLVLLNDEIHAAREVTKTATYRLQTFRAPDFGMLGYVDGAAVTYYRRTERKTAPNTEFDLATMDTLPRVDIAYAHTDGDGAAIDAYVAAGARGIVSAGFAPGMSPPGQLQALERAAAAGVIVLQSTRAGSGMVHDSARLLELGFIPADNLNPQKARLLLALALTVTSDRSEIMRIFKTY
ncbi:MAG: asparaginase [Candidatus Devosia phytovorans]|uniref:Asparaginase n=1 Tax=Candidatus Devosia phytovorans TaxID=3121372 RepID=A0AAJ5VWA7_9HYPH|nr:asparaginase [Devosia sp.]WEK05281.1 MAG: asparaginase [Devosia sp.]